MALSMNGVIILYRLDVHGEHPISRGVRYTTNTVIAVKYTTN